MATNSPQNTRTADIISNLEMTPENKAKKRVRRLIAWTATAIVLVSILVVWGIHDNSAQIKYKTQPARMGNITVTVSATGNLQPTNQVVVGSELSGIVKSVEVDYNDKVKVGQILARLDTSKLSAQILQSQASLDSARANVLQTKATIKETRAALKRLQEVGRLSKNKAVSQSDLDTAEAAYARAEANYAATKAAVLQAEATLKLNQTDLAKTEIRSPINGIVLVRSVEPGQTVAASLQAPVLFTLAEDLSKMELDVAVDEADVGQVKAGQPAVFTVDAYPDRSYPASITQVRYGAKTTNGVVTYEAILKVDNSDLTLRPGMTATADITVNKAENVLVVPNAALRFAPKTETSAAQTRKGSILSKLFPHRPHERTTKVREEMGSTVRTQTVWILSNDKPEPVKVTTGLTDGTKTQVLRGNIKAGTALLVDMETGQQ